MPNIYDAKIYGIRIGEDLTADYCEIDFMQKLWNCLCTWFLVVSFYIKHESLSLNFGCDATRKTHIIDSWMCR